MDECKDRDAVLALYIGTFALLQDHEDGEARATFSKTGERKKPRVYMLSTSQGQKTTEH